MSACARGGIAMRGVLPSTKSHNAVLLSPLLRTHRPFSKAVGLAHVVTLALPLLHHCVSCIAGCSDY